MTHEPLPEDKAVVRVTWTGFVTAVGPHGTATLTVPEEGVVELRDAPPWALDPSKFPRVRVRGWVTKVAPRVLRVEQMREDPVLPEDRYTEASLRTCPPAELLVLLERASTNALRSFVAEALGRGPWAVVGEALCALVTDPSPVVREGALLGLLEHLDQDAARTALAYVRDHDTVPELRSLADVESDDGVST